MTWRTFPIFNRLRTSKDFFSFTATAASKGHEQGLLSYSFVIVFKRCYYFLNSSAQVMQQILVSDRQLRVKVLKKQLLKEKIKIVHFLLLVQVWRPGPKRSIWARMNKISVMDQNHQRPCVVKIRQLMYITCVVIIYLLFWTYRWVKLPEITWTNSNYSSMRLSLYQFLLFCKKKVNSRNEKAKSPKCVAAHKTLKPCEV